MQALIPDRALVDGALVPDVAVLIDGAHIAGVVAAGALPPEAKQVRVAGTLAPGFIDTQVNGVGGVLFNDEPTVEGIAAIGAALGGAVIALDLGFRAVALAGAAAATAGLVAVLRFPFERAAQRDDVSSYDVTS